MPAAPCVGRRLVGRDKGERWRDAVSHALVDRYGRWACGWCWGIDEGDHDGGPVGGWCCVAHSITSAKPTLTLVADSLVEWRNWLEDLTARFDRALPTLDPLVVSHEMIGRMLRRHLLGLEPHEALACAQPNDVIYRIDPTAKAIHAHRHRRLAGYHEPAGRGNQPA